MELLRDLPGELFLQVARFTPHPCAVLMRRLYTSDAWFGLLQRRAMVLYDANSEVGLDTHLTALMSALRP